MDEREPEKTGITLDSAWVARAFTEIRTRRQAHTLYRVFPLPHDQSKTHADSAGSEADGQAACCRCGCRSGGGCRSSCSWEPCTINGASTPRRLRRLFGIPPHRRTVLNDTLNVLRPHYCVTLRYLCRTRGLGEPLACTENTIYSSLR